MDVKADKKALDGKVKTLIFVSLILIIENTARRVNYLVRPI